ncbi:hypothetical protein RHSIM_Rhsim07G0125500 [Rhododendron simsii]|uniref:Uncharacterized protein n=1 Tax=Rhododendron simsii TaxID=118357 RepID=A0A834LIY5_RHOSS|nr:hypothetical protein RHSIM_Rhsim07G0125500 [Rhododendron simsii]
MNLQAPCTFSTLLRPKPPLYWRPPPLKCCLTTTSELQKPVGVEVPSHKVTVHDRKRGLVHEFFVPEGYALLCVGFPSSDIEVETQDEDEERDDYALELAMGDEIPVFVVLGAKMDGISSIGQSGGTQNISITHVEGGTLLRFSSLKGDLAIVVHLTYHKLLGFKIGCEVLVAVLDLFFHVVCPLITVW